MLPLDTSLDPAARQQWQIELVLVGCKNLPKMDIMGHCDPYVIIKDGDNLCYRSAVCYNTANPTYNEELWLEHVNEGTTFMFEVHDKDKGTRDDYVGTAEYTFMPPQGTHTSQAPCVFGQPRDRSMALLELPVLKERKRKATRHKGKKHKGDLILKVRYWPCHGPPAPLMHRGPVSYRTALSVVAGVLTGHYGDDGWLQYAAYKLVLTGVQQFFPEGPTQHWNESYVKAQQIFKNSAMMTAVRTQHSMLYADTGREDKRGQLTCAADFVELLRGGMRAGQPRYYTYVLCRDGCMRFSETGAAYYVDFCSKHAMHADCAKLVYCAGEFCLLPCCEALDSGMPLHGSSPHGGYRMVVDNNSGTYAPSPEVLPALRQLLIFNLPDLQVDTVAASDPRLSEYHSRVPSRCTEPVINK